MQSGILNPNVPSPRLDTIMLHHTCMFRLVVLIYLLILLPFFPQGSLEIFTGLGLVLGPPIGGFLYQSFGYEIPFMVLGCVVLIMVPLNMYLLPTYGRWSSCSFLVSVWVGQAEKEKKESPYT